MIANIAAKIPPITLPLPVECDEMPSSRVKRSGSERTLAPIQFMILRKKSICMKLLGCIDRVRRNENKSLFKLTKVISCFYDKLVDDIMLQS